MAIVMTMTVLRLDTTISFIKSDMNSPLVNVSLTSTDHAWAAALPSRWQVQFNFALIDK
jgi:hypothetical protein